MPAAPDGIERRAGTELRAAAGRRLEGYVASWNAPARIGNFTETIARGAFAGTLARADADVLCLVDHDMGRLLGRTRAGTLRLAEDGRGLAFSVDMPDTTLGRDVLALAERGDLGGMSFGFRVAPGGEAWPAADRRELRALDLVECSVIHAHAAYGDATTVFARSRAAAAQLDQARARRRFLATL